MIFINKIISFLMVALFSVVFFSCQTDTSVEQYSTKKTITKTTPLATYIERIAMQKTMQDNIIDHTDCFMVKFPYVVTVNGVEISILSTEDYASVENNIALNSDDADIVYIHFPISIIFNDYSEKTLDSENDYTDLVEDCDEKLNDLPKINCIDIKYPILIKRYDSSVQAASSVSIKNNEALYFFINNLEDNQFIAIEYPISVSDLNGNQLIINDNNQFENIIKEALDNCSENTNTSLDFVEVLSSGAWNISYFHGDDDEADDESDEDDEDENTNSYSGYQFYFKTDYTVIASKSGRSFIGAWSTKLENGDREFQVNFNEATFDNLKLNWNLFEFNNTKIHFRAETSDNDSETHYLYFTKN
jgi:hypothetical protein